MGLRVELVPIPRPREGTLSGPDGAKGSDETPPPGSIACGKEGSSLLLDGSPSQSEIALTL